MSGNRKNESGTFGKKTSASLLGDDSESEPSQQGFQINYSGLTRAIQQTKTVSDRRFHRQDSNPDPSRSSFMSGASSAGGASVAASGSSVGSSNNNNRNTADAGANNNNATAMRWSALRTVDSGRGFGRSASADSEQQPGASPRKTLRRFQSEAESSARPNLFSGISRRPVSRFGASGVGASGVGGPSTGGAVMGSGVSTVAGSVATGTGHYLGGQLPTMREEASGTPSLARRYKTGDKVLVCNIQSRWANLVNRHGFPPNEGSTPEEQRGPYMYVLATVKIVHFEEFAAYYTVTRADTGADQRADTDFMEPIRTARGEAAALKAATQVHHGGDSSRHGFSSDDGGHKANGNCLIRTLNRIMCVILYPFLFLFDCIIFCSARFLCPLARSCLSFLRVQAKLILYGNSPYVCQMRLTMVNFVVVCSTWFMFIDQARLAIFPSKADTAIAAVNLAVWVVLVLELLFEVFIRPDGYKNLIISDKAFAPTTVRYINAFHLTVESVMLLIFIPEFLCIVSSKHACDDRLAFSFHNAALISVTGPSRFLSFCGKAYFALIRLRVFGLVRHWKNMWIANTFINMKWKSSGGLWSAIVPHAGSRVLSKDMNGPSQAKRRNTICDSVAEEQRRKDAALTNASTIGTALMVTNSYRALSILWLITGIFPLFLAILSEQTNAVADDMVGQLQATNMVANNDANITCDYLSDSVWAWLGGVTAPDFEVDNDKRPFMLTLDLEPNRCFIGSVGSSITEFMCSLGDQNATASYSQLCDDWLRAAKEGMNPTTIGGAVDLRTGSVLLYEASDSSNFTWVDNLTTVPANYSVKASFDQSYAVQTAAQSSLLLQLCVLIAVLGGLSVLRRDAEVLVLGPLRRMLKIVARYAKNPLAQPQLKRRTAPARRGQSGTTASIADTDSVVSDVSSDDDAASTSRGGKQSGNRASEDDLALGSYETEQLITAVTKITDLLRKCWGVAGADIISTNLATQEGTLTEVFNPTVPGQSVYALFAFAAINRFDYALKSLGGDVMILINDVAAVLHGEVFRWGFGDSGQCNKNLGAAFLMVFRIGLVKEVIEKLEQATDVIFSTGTKNSQVVQAARQRRRKNSSNVSTTSSSFGNSSASIGKMSSAKAAAAHLKSKAKRSSSVKAMSLSLQSLPGISTFTDRAVIGMLKSFAGIYRDNKIRNWNNDFRLGAGVGAFTVSMIYGMDAGWAVEGAVGSEYKIDATYLSPHVNMASRMMMASKQYGVNIMLSQSVQELMSSEARAKLRHLDTVTVKGSSVKQKIYTYDARPKGVDFFLYSRSDEQADEDAERYAPSCWNTDQDLKAMRQHVSDEFLQEFNHGRKHYIAGDWPAALKRLERANDIMVETALEEGYLEDEFEALEQREGEDLKAAAEELKQANGDGPSQYLVSFIKSHEGGKAPKGWEGWHPLTRK